jgi:sugar phosphate permease
VSTSLTPAPEATATEDAVFRKVILRIVPFLMLCYVVAYLDRVNVGFAKLQMSADLGFSEAAFGLGAGLFFIGYFLFEVPSNLLLQKVGARIWIARIMITWGVLSAAFMFVQTEAQFYALRFLLGIAEAGFYPGVILYCTYWFPSQRRAKVIAMFMSAIPVAGIFGNPLSGWIMQTFDGRADLSGWQWMFLVKRPSRPCSSASPACSTWTTASAARSGSPRRRRSSSSGRSPRTPHTRACTATRWPAAASPRSG